MIKVISQTTAERDQETMELFHECKPYLDNGYSLSHAVMEIKGIKHGFQGRKWFKELRKYAKKEGYDGRV